MSAELAGTVVAIIGRGSDLDRAVAVALAEAGADIAIATESPVTEQEFSTASIANEVWAIGREQFSSVLDIRSAVAVAAFGAEVRAKLGRADALLVIEPARDGASLHRAGEAFAGDASSAALRLLIGATADGWTTIPRATDGETAAATVALLCDRR